MSNPRPKNPKSSNSNMPKNKPKRKQPKQQLVQQIVVRAPTSKAVRQPGSRPRFTTTSNGIRIRHRELIWLLQASNSTASQFVSFSLNPALAQTFPWLARVAGNFDTYKFHALRYEFVSNRATTTEGSVFMSVDYDALDTPPTDAYSQSPNPDSKSSNIWDTFSFSSNPRNLHKLPEFYTRSSSVTGDLKTYDVGLLTIGVYGSSTTSTIGQVFLSYDVELITPSSEGAASGNSVAGQYTGTTNAAPYAVSAGNMPVTSVTSGTTTAVTTFTFTRPWEGNVASLIVGTGLSTLVYSGTVTYGLDVQSVSTTVAIAAWRLITASVGQTLVLTVANTTVTQSILVFSQGGN